MTTIENSGDAGAQEHHRRIPPAAAARTARDHLEARPRRRFDALVAAVNSVDRGLPPAAKYPLRSRTTLAAGCPHAGDRRRVG
ncbi:hypothetical protein AB0H60_26350 [Nocardia rhamnosiphila]|uniref:hypothetical protein n=1 Tax=Nocardia rhamnosiphila TaxID=426716 RepID=UPI0033E36F13